MILKSLYIASIVLNLIGMNGMSAKFDAAIKKVEQGSPSTVQASDRAFNYLPELQPRPRIDKNTAKPNILADYYILTDLESNTTILKQNMNARVPIASTTKIMTALVALEAYNLSDIATISSTASTQEGADAYLIPGEKITISELLHCLLIKSGNDSAYAIAEHINSSEETGVQKFVDMMNQRAISLGMKDSQYMDPAGLDTTGYSSAYNLFLVTREALKNPTFREIIKTKEYVAKSADGTRYHQLTNSNRLVNEYDYPGAIGVKTGYMPEAGHCLVSAVEREGHTLIGVILHTAKDTASASAYESRKLMDWGFANIKWQV